MMAVIGSVLFTLILVATGIVLLQPEWLVAMLREQSPQVFYSVTTQELAVALTIDDGPDPVHTSKILDILKKHGAKATFFLITDHIPGNEALVRRMVDEGHEIANHLTADEPSIRLSPSEFERQLQVADGVLSEFADIRWVRPGSGWYNDEMLSIIQQHGHRCALGSIYPYDPQIGSAWFSARYVVWKAHPGSVIVLHDFGIRGARTASALERILPELQGQGYRVVTLSALEALDSVFE
jgi:peptidoglycan/xylan/chitin deacetylase (PgdA/CDA1 family)